MAFSVRRAPCAVWMGREGEQNKHGRGQGRSGGLAVESGTVHGI